MTLEARGQPSMPANLSTAVDRRFKPGLQIGLQIVHPDAAPAPVDEGSCGRNRREPEKSPPYASGVQPSTMSKRACNSPWVEPGTGSNGRMIARLNAGSWIRLRMPSVSFAGSPSM